MRLLVLPCDPDSPGGYNRVVFEDLERVGRRSDDCMIVYLEPGKRAADGIRVIPRPRRGSVRQLRNVLSLRHMSEVRASEIRKVLPPTDFESIFCGDIIFYRALRELFPDRRMTVRLHNLFALAESRWRWRREQIDLHFWLTLRLTSRLERLVCADPLADVIFINDRERTHAELHWPGRAFDLWGVGYRVHPEVMRPSKARLIYFGGTASHQRIGVRRFIDDTFAELRAKRSDTEFHLWGHGTESFDDPARGVFGHGFHAGSGLPLEGDGLFVIPDLLGGGVKVKTGDALRQGVAFLTTPFGAEGYEFDRVEGRMVAEMPAWAGEIERYFRSLGVW